MRNTKIETFIRYIIFKANTKESDYPQKGNQTKTQLRRKGEVYRKIKKKWALQESITATLKRHLKIALGYLPHISTLCKFLIAHTYTTLKNNRKYLR